MSRLREAHSFRRYSPHILVLSSIHVLGANIAQEIDGYVDDALKWLREDTKETKKLAALLALKELLIEAPIITFNKIFNTQHFNLIWEHVR
jgi:hypothetical protein